MTMTSPARSPSTGTDPEICPALQKVHASGPGTPVCALGSLAPVARGCHSWGVRQRNIVGPECSLSHPGTGLAFCRAEHRHRLVSGESDSVAQAVLVDIDGTLIDSNSLHVLAWLRAFRRVGKEIDGSQILHLVGMGTDTLAPQVLGEGATEDIERVRQYHGEEYSEKGLIDHAEPLPGAADLLQALKERQLRVALASSGKEEEIARYLAYLGGEEAVSAIITSGDVSGSKPEPDVFKVALERLDNPESAVVIGDTIYDIEAARKLDLPCVCVLTGGIKRELLEEAGAASVYKDAYEVMSNLDAVLGARLPA